MWNESEELSSSILEENKKTGITYEDVERVFDLFDKEKLSYYEPTEVRWGDDGIQFWYYGILQGKR